MKLARALQETNRKTETYERILRRTGDIIEQNKRLTALNLIAASVSRSLDLQETLKNAIEQVLQLMGFEAGWIALRDEGSAELVVEAHRGLGPPVISLIERVKPGDVFFGPVVEGGEPQIGNISHGREGRLARQLERGGFSFFVAIPLKAKGRALGVMVLCCRRSKQVDRNSHEFLSSVGETVGVAIENAALYRDVTQLAQRLKLQSVQLRESEQKYRSLIENAKDAVVLIQDGRIRYANQSAAEISGYSLEELYQLDNVLELVPDRDQVVMRPYCDDLRGGDDIPRLEVGARRKDGKDVCLEVGGSIIEYQGRPAMQYIIRDVTERKFLREQVLRSEKMAALGQLISGVAHELNNPLTTVVGYGELLSPRKDLPESVQQGLKMIQEAAWRAGQIVRNLLMFARQHQATQVEVSINELIERTLALRMYELRVSNIEVVRELASTLPPTVADPYQLQQVFINLIVNAEQAMLEAHGRGRLLIRTQVEHLPPQAPGTPGRAIVISFADDGPGIQPAQMTRIFEPFFTTKPVGQGTGLGLSISHSIIQSHGGRLDVHSEPGQGATFVIQLPVVQQPQAKMSSPPAMPPRKEVTPKHVFIIDDEPGIVDLLREIVTAEGHRVETTTSGTEALAELRRKEYDLIFCDIRMPEVDGQHLYHEIKRFNSSLADKMIFVTGDVISPQTREFLMDSGSRFLEKPFISEEVVRLIRRILAD